MTVEEQFTKIVRELASRLERKEKEAAELRRKLTIANFPTQQATECGKCGEYKHTPWKDEEHGYVCAACMHTMCTEGADDFTELTCILTEMTVKGYWLFLESKQMYEVRFFPAGENLPENFDVFKSVDLLKAVQGAAEMELKAD